MERRGVVTLCDEAEAKGACGIPAERSRSTMWMASAGCLIDMDRANVRPRHSMSDTAAANRQARPCWRPGSAQCPPDYFMTCVGCYARSAP
jgi:hypothetical protein